MSNKGFARTLEEGLVGESIIAKYLRGKGHFILPVYEVMGGKFEGPRLLTPTDQLIAPDMFVFTAGGLKVGKKGGVFWVEAKTKTGFTRLRMPNRDELEGIYQTGIDKHHYDQYIRVVDETGWDVILLFYHKGGYAKDSGPETPSGLFGGSLSRLRDVIDHSSDKWGKGGMVYWNIYDLRPIATVEQVEYYATLPSVKPAA
jgi:hypothetical protein